ncbi:hypothetical protein [Arthrobacter ramosus]|uniref:Uncharacterized protein n=1 Tax=Arthrobacter ramosus TaxID=1672 RepID=A0ABV5Y376_ARTRM|nr:hypothetical protein [Arthrobacter ramosus]
MGFLANWLRKMGDHADGWKNGGDSWSYLRPVQFRSMEDLQAIADVMTEQGGVARFTFEGYNPKTLSEIEQTADADLNQIWIAAFTEDPGPEAVTLSGSFAWVRIANEAFMKENPGVGYLTIYVGNGLQDKVAASGAIRQLTVSTLSERVRRACESVKPPRGGRYPVIDTITKATLKQRQHDKKIRRQAAWISFAASIVTTVLTSGVLHFLFPQAAGK